MPQIVSAIIWYLLLAGLGWLVVPIAYRFLHALPDRGLAFTRPLGLLLWGFTFWILSSYGLLQNNLGGLLTAAALLAAVSYWAWCQIPGGELGKWLRSQRGLIIGMEVLFLVAFLFMTFIRASRPDINHTEQPMELAFINAILRSPTMPPHDPWLSGFSISYYYFGYLMVAMLAKLTGVIGSVAFNLGFISIFSMAAIAAYGLAANLLTVYRPQAIKAFRWLALLAPLSVLILGNFEGLLEIAHARHVFWQTDATGARTSDFWAWLDVKDLIYAPVDDPQFQPRLYGTGAWWWWRASRVINDRTFLGDEQELIDEFPAFSFVLGDLHPHVLSMPFVMLAIGTALNVYLGAGQRKKGLIARLLHVELETLIFTALVVGALGFINIWDFPIYVGLVSLAYGTRRVQTENGSWAYLTHAVPFGLVSGLLGIVLYLPFYIGFTSQAAGILPNLLNPSRGAHLWIMFGPAFILLFTFLIISWFRNRDIGRLLKYVLIGFGVVFAFGLISFGLTWLYMNVVPASQQGELLVALGAADASQLISESTSRRMAGPGGWITLSILLGMLLGLFFQPADRRQTNKAVTAERQATSFMILLTVVATLLVIVPEFIYLRDQFGTRMNTVFKFYFQAWQMWAIAGVFIMGVLFSELHRVGRALFVALVALLVFVGLIYPAYAFADISRRAPEEAFTLDGARWLSADTVAAMAWLRLAPVAPLAEAIGGSYNASFARFAAHSGQQAIMGWPGHEGQWRGGNVDFARISDIEALYSTADWNIAQTIIDRYGIRYVVISEVERNTYPVDENKFQQNLNPVFQNAAVTIYEVP
jgi:YYY domain-containing protein